MLYKTTFSWVGGVSRRGRGSIFVISVVCKTVIALQVPNFHYNVCISPAAVSPERSTEPSEPEPSEPEPSETAAMVVEKGVVSSTICHSKLGNGYATTHPIHSNMEQ